MDLAPHAAARDAPRPRHKARAIRGVVCDLDGVLTQTDRAHRLAWRQALAPVLDAHGLAQPSEALMAACLDGRSRMDGLDALLDALGLALPAGEAGAAPGCATRQAIAAAKQARYLAVLDASGAKPYDDARRLLGRLAAAGVPLAVASASASARRVLHAAALSPLVGVVVDGSDRQRLGLPGKAGQFRHAAALLGLPPDRCAVVEDAPAGVRAAEGFGLVVGVDRARTGQLAPAGADLVVPTLDHPSLPARLGLPAPVADRAPPARASLRAG